MMRDPSFTDDAEEERPALHADGSPDAVPLNWGYDDVEPWPAAVVDDD